MNVGALLRLLRRLCKRAPHPTPDRDSCRSCGASFDEIAEDSVTRSGQCCFCAQSDRNRMRR